MADDKGNERDERSAKAADADLRGLSTFQFALVVVAGLMVFTLVVAGLSLVRRSTGVGDLTDLSIDEQTVRERGVERFELDENGEPVDPTRELPRPVAKEPSRIFGEPTSLPDILTDEIPLDPRRHFHLDGNPSARYGPDGAPVVPVRFRRDHTGLANWRQNLKSIIGRIFRYIQSPEKAAKRVQDASAQYLRALDAAFKQLDRAADGRVQVTYQLDLDERIIVAEAAYRQSLDYMMDIYLEGIEGTPSCVGTMPTAESLNQTRLPTFDPKLQGGEDAIEPSYILGAQTTDPFTTIGRAREHVAVVLDCVGQAKNPIGLQVTEGNREVYRQETMPIPIPDAAPGEKTTMLPPVDLGLPVTESVTPGMPAKETPKPPPAIYGALKPGEDPHATPTPTPVPTPARAVRPDETPPGIYGALKPGEDPRATPTPTPAPTPATPTPFPTPSKLPKGIYGPLNPGE